MNKLCVRKFAPLVSNFCFWFDSDQTNVALMEDEVGVMTAERNSMGSHCVGFYISVPIKRKIEKRNENSWMGSNVNLLVGTVERKIHVVSNSTIPNPRTNPTMSRDFIEELGVWTRYCKRLRSVLFFVLIAI